MEWSKLSMPERAEYIRLGVLNGITSLDAIRETYNSYAGGGDLVDDALDYIPMSISNLAHKIGTGNRTGFSVEELSSDPGNLYLLSDSRRDKRMKNLGYTRQSSTDYGLVTKAVGGRNLPIYQRGVDAISRESIKAIPTDPITQEVWDIPKRSYTLVTPNGDRVAVGVNTVGVSKSDLDTNSLLHAGNYISSLYRDNDNKFYIKGWDLNDYGDEHGAGTRYNKVKQFLANTYDKIGNPFVATTGITELQGLDDNISIYEDSQSNSNIPYKEAPSVAKVLSKRTLLSGLSDLVENVKDENINKEAQKQIRKLLIENTVDLKFIKSRFPGLWDE